MLMPGRKYSVANTSYRYGFNGKELDSESPVQYDYGFRIYDPRLARFKSVDPLTNQFPELTPYQFASNNPILGIDLDGKEFENYNSSQIVKTHGVAALNTIDYHHGYGLLLKASYNIHAQGNAESFQRLKTAYTTDPGILHNPNNKWAKYDVLHPLPRSSNWGPDKEDPSKKGSALKIGDNMHIEITSLYKLDIYVRFTDIQVTENSFTIKAATLYGHTDAGTITFSGSFDPKTSKISFAIYNETTGNVGGDLITGIGRDAQQSQWTQVLNNVANYLGGKIESKTLTKEFSEQDAKKGDPMKLEKIDLNIGTKSSEIKAIQ